MSFVNRQLYKQKPQAWGPVSSVRASIFKNAERAGFPLPYYLIPFWPYCNFDLINLTKGAGSNTTWCGQGMKFEHDSSYFDTNVPVYSSFVEYTFMFTGQKVPGVTLNPYTYFHNNASGEFGYAGCYINTSTGELNHRIGSSTTYLFSPSQNIMDGDVHNITASVYSISNDYKKFYIDKKLEWHNIQAVDSKSNNSDILIGGSGAPSRSSCMCFFQAVGWNNTLSDDLVFYLHDNPYFLLHRQAPVFYSVPGGAITIKTITDTVSCLDEIAQISNIFTLSDTGTCLDGFSGLIAGLSVVDAGVGVDTVKPIAVLTVQDTGSAIDLIQQVSAACSVADTGTGTDSIGQLLASLVVSDAGAGADVITVLKELLKTVTDSGTGTDSISRILASLSVSDTGSSTDTISQIIAGVSVSDDGSGADFINLLKDILKTISDTGSGTDSVSIQPVSVSVQDVGLALDLIGNIAVELSITDSATAAEIISTIKTKLVAVSDYGIGSDNQSISVSLTVADTMTAIDAIKQIINSLSISDAGFAIESIAKIDLDNTPTGHVRITITLKAPGISITSRSQGINISTQ